MIKNKHLIILINDFPYNNGEPFFEKEIKYLHNKFDEISILSVVGKKNDKPTRDVGEGIAVYPLGCNHNRIKYCIIGAFSSNKIFNCFSIKGKRILSALYLKGRNVSIYRKAKRFIKDTINKDTNYYLYSYWLTLGISTSLLQIYLEKLGAKYVRSLSRCHGYDVYNELHPFSYIPFQQKTISMLDSIYPCSQYGQTYLTNRYPNLANKIKVAYLFSEDHGVSNCSDNTDKKIFLTISGFRKIKRLDLFAQAFSVAAKNRENITWVAIGDGEDFEKVKNIINKNGIENKVEFLGNIPNDGVYDYYKSHNVYFFCNVSYSEGIPVSIMEAASFGIPVLATNVGGSSEIVSENNGILIQRDIDYLELAKKIEQCINIENAKYFEMRKQSRIIWEEKFNSKKNLELWYKEIVGDKNE